jgi:muramoyltetrapeptide carboxypeptidase
MPDTKGKILFLEDVDEYLYHIDRMMMNLKRSGKLDHLSGMIVGGMTDMKDNQVPFGKTANEIIYDAVREFDYPLCFDFPAGHLDNNLALVLGRKTRLTVDREVEISFY